MKKLRDEIATNQEKTDTQSGVVKQTEVQQNTQTNTWTEKTII